VSIVVVAYNNWPDLELAIQSALCQSYRPIEVIVVDNSSADETPIEVPRRFGDRVKYIKQPNSGDAGAYNTGFRHSEGQFVQFLDGDDVLCPYKIEKQMEVFRAAPETDLVYGELRGFRAWAGVDLPPERRPPDCDDMLAAALGPEEYDVPTVLSALMRRQAVERVGPWDEVVYVTDVDYWLRAAWLGCRFRLCPGIHGFVRAHPRQMSANVPAMLRGTEAVLRKALGYIDREPYRTMARTRLAQVQYFRAVSGRGVSRREALAKLREARETKREEVPLLAYCVGLAAIVALGGSRIMLSPRFRALRRFVARLVGYHIPGT
jgi:glycosyltransferase involved in cell wall biosynthesis